MSVQPSSSAPINTAFHNTGSNGTGKLNVQPIPNQTSSNVIRLNDNASGSDGFTFTFRGVKLPETEKNGMKIGADLDGTMFIQYPEITSDIQLGFMKINKLELDAKMKTRTQLNVAFSVGGDNAKIGGYANKIQKINFKKNMKLGDIQIPTELPGVFIQAGVYLQLNYGYSYGPEINVLVQADTERGFVYNGNTTKLIKHDSGNFNMGVRGKGEISGDIGPAVDVGLSAFDVVSGGLEAFADLEGEGGVYGGTNGQSGFNACWKASLEGAAEGRVYADLFDIRHGNYDRIVQINLAKFTFPPHVELGNCQIVQNLIVGENTISLHPGEKKEIPIQAEFIDLSNNNKVTKPIEGNESKDLKITTSNDQVANGSYEDGNLVIQASQNPSATQDDITVEYENSNILDGAQPASIPITVKIINELPSLSKANAGTSTSYLMDTSKTYTYSSNGNLKTYTYKGKITEQDALKIVDKQIAEQVIDHNWWVDNLGTENLLESEKSDGLHFYTTMEILYPVVVGKKWTFDYNEDGSGPTPMEIVSTNNTITTPAGTFENVIKIRVNNSEEYQYYAAGIGLILIEYNGTKPYELVKLQNAPSPSSYNDQADIEQDVAFLKSKARISVDGVQWEPIINSSPDAEVPDGSGGTLYAWNVILNGNGDGSAQQIFFFDNNRYIGTDTANYHTRSKVKAGSTGTFVATYTHYLANDPNSSPSGQPFIVRFHWNGSGLTPDSITSLNEAVNDQFK
ncbi:LppP/LprE family lipoprotein [Neobacillus pocheonensis]|uniref:LppP/LprE family lipoprotein n=1 Tax=Neobacillus pocheonensis TaxID=363869 RepID=A0ABT0WFY0_9BACI|nr:LppP/LprE family lipoprotein [Neobacillus pocheonensis]